MQSADVVVVGLGAMGSATVYQLARRGARVIGIDRFTPPHDRGSSHGESRITRQAVGEGEEYVPLVRRSHEIWRELEAETGERLLLPVGALLLGREGGPAQHHGREDFVRRTIAVARRHRIAEELQQIPDGVTVHVLPTGEPNLPARVMQRLRYRNLTDVRPRIARAYEASAAHLARIQR